MTKTNEHHAETKDHTGDRFSADLETLQSSFAQLREDVTKLLHNAAGAAKSGAGAVKDRAAGAVGDLKDRGVDSFEQVGEKISEQPILSAVIFFGLGFIAAKLLSRK